MLRISSPSASLLILLVAFSGCLGDDGDAAGTGPQEFDPDETGRVIGKVVDTELQPVVSAQVGLLATEFLTTTDASGTYAIPGVPPGRYTLAVQRLGFESAALQVNVVAGEDVKADVTIAAIAIQDAYSETWADKGYFECSWSIVIARGPCFFPGPQIPAPNNRREFNYEVGEGVSTVIVEMSWEQTSVATGDAMSLFLSYTDRTTSHWYCNAESPSPVVLRWERGDMDDDEGECLSGGAQLPSDEPGTIPLEGQELTSRANGGASDTLPNPGGFGLGVALQQSFDVYFSNFYWEAAPEDYTGIPDN
jgi:hypothetical protein